MLSSPNDSIIIARASATRFARFAQNLMHREIASGLQIKGRTKSIRPPSCVEFCTLISKICQSNHLPLHHAITTAVQMAASVPEIMDAT
jgi:hypothetical protein